MAFRHSLRLRLLLAFVIVALAPVGAVAFLVNRATTQQFREYSGDRATTDAQAVAYQTSQLTGVNSIVVGANQSVLAVASPAEITNIAGEQRATNASPGATVGGSLGSADPVSMTAASAKPAGFFITLPSSPDQAFLDNVHRALLITAGVAAAGAVLLAIVFARQIVRPVESLTLAAEGMAAGDPRRRVTIRSQNEIGMLGRAFNTMAESRDRIEALRRNLVNDVAHELRTPLAALQGYLEVLRDGDAAPTPEILAILHDDSLLLSRLVADLQELALAEAGELPLERVPLDITGAIDKAVESLRPLAGEREIAISNTAPSRLPLASADADRLGQILRNLIRNAIAHTPPGGSIVASAERRGAMLAVTVRDSGSGIAPEHAPFVFDRFYRADPARSRTTGGAGLGLAIVKNLVQAHGGEIGVVSYPGSGAAFTFTLPVATGGKRTTGS